MGHHLQWGRRRLRARARGGGVGQLPVRRWYRRRAERGAFGWSSTCEAMPTPRQSISFRLYPGINLRGGVLEYFRAFVMNEVQHVDVVCALIRVSNPSEQKFF